MLEKQAYSGVCRVEHEEINTQYQLQVRLNRRVTFDCRIEVPSPSFFFFNKK